ncbi:MAG: CDP-diacylglycerol--glycerol-3-phosphate 3-phosphatidyltransferase [Rhodospirillales bacterium]|nr:CDP-diacylglycerol--glycerol-3-phosphate 3-phosphatidyltransferase [Rhodospirillales bacterium]
MNARQLLLPPNLLSLTRYAVGPTVLLTFDVSDDSTVILALILMLIAEATDVLDGWVARRFGQVTNLGKLLDPLSDSMYRFCIFLAFFSEDLMTAWMIVVIFGRDILVAYVRAFAASNGIVLAARTSGKVKAVVQGIAQVGLVAMLDVPSIVDPAVARSVGHWLLMIAVLVTAYSAFDYLIGTVRGVVAKTQNAG